MYIDCHTVYRKEIFDVVCYVCYRIGGGGGGGGGGWWLTDSGTNL